MPTADELASVLRARIPGVAHVEVTDDSDGCGAKFTAIIVASSFEGKAVLDRQRSVHDVLKEEMKTIHAIQLRTWTPAQWEEKRKQLGK